MSPVLLLPSAQDTTPPSSEKGELLAAALAYARRGWPVLPLRRNAKAPVGWLVPHGVKDATTDESTIRQWWARCPNANVGIAAGAVSGLVIIDVDERNGGSKTMLALTADKGDLPHTRTGGTGNGRHLYFRHPGSVVRGRLGPGVDVKADGGYVVAPPSRHPNGQHYRWVSDEAPAELPRKWRKALQRDASRQKGSPPDTSPTQAVCFTDEPVDRYATPERLVEHGLSPDTRRLIETGDAARFQGDRSRRDQSVVLKLRRAGATYDEIRAIFIGFPVGEKYREKGTHGDAYLAQTIAKADDFRPSPQRGPRRDYEFETAMRYAGLLRGLAAAGPSTVDDLVALTGRHRHTVSAALAVLTEAGFVEPGEPVRRGRRGPLTQTYVAVRKPNFFQIKATLAARRGARNVRLETCTPSYDTGMGERSEPIPAPSHKRHTPKSHEHPVAHRTRTRPVGAPDAGTGRHACG